MDCPIGRVEHVGLLSGLYVADRTGGKPALSRWRLVRQLPSCNASILAVEIFTGGLEHCTHASPTVGI